MKHPIWTVLGTVIALIALLFAIFIWFVPNPKMLSGTNNPPPNSTQTNRTNPTSTSINHPPSPTHTPNTNPPTYTPDQGYILNYVTFSNTTTGKVFIYLVNSQKKEELFNELQPNTSYQQSAAIGSMWDIKDSNGNILKEVTITSNEQTITI